ncbi:MAG: lysine--tRNA ligase, partial [Bacteroidales bacterium]|nr:lysine--tRNA ligase [Bacteroidales bacterium]
MDENNTNEYHVRLQKLKALREAGIQPYIDRYERTHMAKEALEFGESSDLRDVDKINSSPTDKTLRLAGRLMTFRSHGKLAFGNLQDFSGQIQLAFMQDRMGKDGYKFLKKFDVADHVGVEGELFRTKHGEVTLMVYNITMISKTLRPLPEKWHGLKDREQIYRQRYLDTTMNRESLDRFVFRSNLIKALREFYWQEGFLEIETPVLENISSGATAKPFITHHNALDIDVYLRIAAGELWQKMAMIGGFEKTFEVARCFRNEGMDPSHLQEFTMVEHYAAYWDFEDNMKFTERMFEYVLNKLLGTTKVNVKDRDGNDVEVDFKTPWSRKRFTELI